MAENATSLFGEIPVRFGPAFLRDHAGHIMSDSRIAVVELIANSYDAGATEVRIAWPDQVGEPFEITDNGTGMSRPQFDARWRTLSYSRKQEQGEYAEFPPGVKASGPKRIAFGQTGKGRHGAFCFGDSYVIETWRDGKFSRVKVSFTAGGVEPFHCELEAEGERPGHGTKISSVVVRGFMPVAKVREVIGSKFLVDPDFRIVVNGQPLELVKLEGVLSMDVEVPGHGTVRIHQIDGAGEDRTTGLRGITWWVNGRMVGQPSWSGLDERGAILDGRTAPAKRYSFVVEADILKEDVKADWSGFHSSKRSTEVNERVRDHVIASLNELLAASRKERKKAAIEEHRHALKGLPPMSRRVVGQFIDETLQKCPSLSQGDLSRTVEVLAKLEQARSGYDLLERLVTCSPEDLDTWNQIMLEWTAQDAEIVLGELSRRLKLIEQLQQLVHSTEADELHDLQPLFERGLWMFGPEYEAVDFRSNRSMATVIRKFLKCLEPDASSKRPDFVALPDASIAAYSADEFDSSGEVFGYRKVLIVELKKGGFLLTQKEIDQARDYAKELRTASKVQPTTEIVAYVLGAQLEPGLVISKYGDRNETRIIPMDYDSLLTRAHARTFHLQKKLEQAAVAGRVSDPDVDDVVDRGQKDLFGSPLA